MVFHLYSNGITTNKPTSHCVINAATGAQFCTFALKVNPDIFRKLERLVFPNTREKLAIIEQAHHLLFTAVCFVSRAIGDAAAGAAMAAPLFQYLQGAWLDVRRTSVLHT